MSKENQLFQPMLASAIEDLEALRLPVLGSVKLDGVRAVVRGGQLLSRSLKPIKNRRLQETLGHDCFKGLDGELICGDPTAPDVFQRSQSMIKADGDVSDATFFVFDWCLDPVLPFHRRQTTARAGIGGSRAMIDGIVIELVRQQPLQTLDQVRLAEEQAILSGYEGLMLRDPEGHYKHGRSTVTEGLLLKLKRFEHAEAEVVDAYEQLHNGNEKMADERGYSKRSNHRANKTGKGTLGGFTVRVLNGQFEGVSCDVGTGWTDGQRAEIWEAWQKRSTAASFNSHHGLLRLKYQKAGSKDKPRFPVFDGWRHHSDTS